MAKIYKISGYLIDEDYYFNDRDDVENCFSGTANYTTIFDDDLFFRRMTIEEADIYEDENKFDDIGIDLAELEKYFPMADTSAEYDGELPKAGETWKHFKGKTVEIVGIGRYSENTNNYMVAYNCPNGMYFRPLDMFMSLVDREKYPDVEQKYRFEKVED